jgi:hypothetical protein
MKEYQSKVMRSMVGMLSACCLAMVIHDAQAAQQCYDFGNLPLNVQHNVGDFLSTGTIDVQVKDFYLTSGVPYGALGQLAEVVDKNIAGGASRPELWTYLTTMQVTPRLPVTKVTMYFAESTSPYNLPIANLEVNGDMRVYNGLAQALPQAHLDRFGTASTGRADVAVNWTPPPVNTKFNHGTLEITALPGEYIHTFSFGGDDHYFDDVCLVW